MWISSLALSLAAFTVLFNRSSVPAGRLYSLQDSYQGLSFFDGFDFWTVGNQDQPSQSPVVNGRDAECLLQDPDPTHGFVQ